MNKILSFFIILLIFSIDTIATPITETFDGWTDGTYGTISTYTDGAGGMWETNNSICDPLNARSGNVIRFNDDSGSNEYLLYKGIDGNGKDGGIGTFSFWYRHWDGNVPTEPVQFQVQYNQGGAGWMDIGTVIDVTSTTYAQFSQTVNLSGDDILFRIISIDDKERLLIDDMSVTDYVVSSPPVITSSLTDSGDCNTSYSYQIVATNSPTGYTATGLPTGLNINTSTGEITGIPTSTGLHNVTITASNASGTDTEILALTINAATPTVSLQVALANVTENGISYTISVDGLDCATSSYSVELSVTGGTAPGGDYTFTSPTTLSFTGSETKTATVTIIDNALIDGDRTIEFSLGNPSGANLGTITNLILTIQDDEVVPFTYMAGDWRTKQATGLTYNSTANWESYDGTTWTAESLAPENCACSPSRIIIEHYTHGGGNSNTTSITTPFNSDFIIRSGGELNFLDNAANPIDFNTAGNSITVLDGGILNVQGDVHLPTGTFLVVESGGKIIMDQNTISLNHPIFGGIEDFQEESIYEILDYDWTSSNLNRRLLDLNATYTISQNTSGQGYYFGNVIINATPTNNLTLFGGNTSVNLIQNNLDITNNGAEPIVFSGNANGPEIIVGGNVTLHVGILSFGTQFGSGSSTQVIRISGNLNTNGTATLRELNSGTSVSTEVYVEGDVTISGGVLQTADDVSLNNNALFIFTGTQAQTFSNAGTVNLYDVKIDKTGDVVTLNNDLQIKDELIMNQGNFITQNNKIILGESTTNLGTLTYTDGFVVGTMRRYFNGTNSGVASGLFPLGTATNLNRFAQLDYTTAASTGGYMDAVFVPIPMGIAGLIIPMANCGGCGFDVEETSFDGYWEMTPQSSTLADGNYTLACTGESFSGITDLAELTLLKRIGAGDWTAPATHIPATGTIAKPTVSRSGLMGWSNFGFGGGVPNPLPVELIDFKAQEINHEILLTWTTLSEMNHKEFIVEKSNNGIDFYSIDIVQGNGNSNDIQHYNSWDKTPNVGMNYYRLQQVDFNGEFEYSNIVSIEIKNKKIKVYPSLTFSNITIHGITENVSIEIYSSLGKLIQVEKTNQDQEINVTHLSKGLYIIHIKNEMGNLLFSDKIIKK